MFWRFSFALNTSTLPSMYSERFVSGLLPGQIVLPQNLTPSPSKRCGIALAFMHGVLSWRSLISFVSRRSYIWLLKRLDCMLKNKFTKISFIPRLTLFLRRKPKKFHHSKHHKYSSTSFNLNDFTVSFIDVNIFNIFCPNSVALMLSFSFNVNMKLIRRRNMQKIFFSPSGNKICEPFLIFGVRICRQWLYNHAERLQPVSTAFTMNSHTIYALSYFSQNLSCNFSRATISDTTYRSYNIFAPLREHLRLATSKLCITFFSCLVPISLYPTLVTA